MILGILWIPITSIAQEATAKVNESEPSKAAATAPAPQNPLEKIHSLEKRASNLDTKIKQAKARIDIIKKALLTAGVKARAIIEHKNEMGSSFRLVRVIYSIDDSEIYDHNDDSDNLDKKRSIEIFNGIITPGKHTIFVTMFFQGQGYGILSYLKGQQQQISSSHEFDVKSGQELMLAVRVFEQKDKTVKERLTIKVDTKTQALKDDAPPVLKTPLQE